MRRDEMTAAAKFRVTCDRCGARQPRATTAGTAANWMGRHERDHRATPVPTHTTDHRAAGARESEEL